MRINNRGRHSFGIKSKESNSIKIRLNFTAIFQIGRYWTKEERKKHLEKSKERKQRQEILQASRNIDENNDIAHQKQSHCAVSKKTSNNIDNAVKKHKTKKNQKESYDNFPTVQDVLLHGSKVVPNQSSKMIGLLSVTTV